MKVSKKIFSLALTAVLLLGAVTVGMLRARAQGETLLDSFDIVNGASVRIIDQAAGVAAKENGLRFSISMKQTDYNAFVAAHAKDASLKFGLLIAPDEEKYDLTVEKVFGPKKQYDWATWNTSTKKWDDPKTGMTQIINFETAGLYLADSSRGEEPDKVYYRASILDFAPEDITRNFQAVGYVCYTENGQKTYKLTGKVSRSMALVAQKAIALQPTLADSDDEWLRKTYLEAIQGTEANYTVEYYKESADGYSVEPFRSEVKTARIDSDVTIDQLELPGFVYDEAQENVPSGKVWLDGSLVLKRYYKDPDHNEGNALVDYYAPWGGSEANSGTISYNTDPDGLFGGNGARSVKIEDKDITGYNDYMVKIPAGYAAFSADVKVEVVSDSAVTRGLPLYNDASKYVSVIKLGQWQKIYAGDGNWGLTFHFPDLLVEAGKPTGTATIYLDNITFYTQEQVEDGSWLPKDVQANYTVEYYKESVDGYGEPFQCEVKTAPVGTEFAIDAIELPGFVYDEAQANVLSGKVQLDGSLVLRRYYKDPDHNEGNALVDYYTPWGGSEANSGTISYNTDPDGLFGGNGARSVKIEDKDITRYNEYVVKIPTGYYGFTADVKVVLNNASAVPDGFPLMNDGNCYLGVIKFGQWQKIYSGDGNWGLFFQFPQLTAEDASKPITATIYLDNITFYTQAQVEDGSWAPKEGEANYAVEYYKESAKGYDAEPFLREVKTVSIGSEVTIDQIELPGFVYDEGQANVLSGKVTFDNTLVLKRYYKDPDHNEGNALVDYFPTWGGSAATASISQNTDPDGLFGGNGAYSVKIEDYDITEYNDYAVKIPAGYVAFSADVKVVLHSDSAVTKDLSVTNEEGNSLGVIKLGQWQKIYASGGHWGVIFQFPELIAGDADPTGTATIYLDNITFYTQAQVDDGSWNPTVWVANSTGTGDGDAIADMEEKFTVTLGTDGSLYKNYRDRYLIQTNAGSVNGSHTVKVKAPRFTDVSGYAGISFAIDLQMVGGAAGGKIPLYLVKKGVDYTKEQLNGMTNLSDSTIFTPIHSYTVDAVGGVFNGSEIVTISKEQLEAAGYDLKNLNDLTFVFCDVELTGGWWNVYNMYFYDFRVY